MKIETRYRLLLVLFCACFALLFVNGAERLFAEAGDAASAPVRIPYAVYLSEHADAPHTLIRTVKKDASQHQQLCCSADHEKASSALMVSRCDSNGNILLHRSYMRAVYQAFALGDGFV